MDESKRDKLRRMRLMVKRVERGCAELGEGNDTAEKRAAITEIRRVHIAK